MSWALAIYLALFAIAFIVALWPGRYTGEIRPSARINPISPYYSAQLHWFYEQEMKRGLDDQPTLPPDVGSGMEPQEA